MKTGLDLDDDQKLVWHFFLFSTVFIVMYMHYFEDFLSATYCEYFCHSSKCFIPLILPYLVIQLCCYKGKKH